MLYNNLLKKLIVFQPKNVNHDIFMDTFNFLQKYSHKNTQGNNSYLYKFKF